MCNQNQLSTLTLNNTAMTYLDCSSNQLAALDVSSCTALTTLYCYQNQIKDVAMDALVGNLPQVTDGEFYVYNIATSTDGNVCTKTQVTAAQAKGWTVYYNESGTWQEYEDENADNGDDTVIAIDETNFPDENFRNYLLGQSYGEDGILTGTEINKINSIFVTNKNIASLKGIEYFTALKTLSCGNNQLTDLDVSKNTALEDLTCSSNKLTTIDLSSNVALKELGCYWNQLTALDLTNNTELTNLRCFGNQLTALDLSNNTALTRLECYNNSLATLDLSNNTKLQRLNCFGCQLTTLDLSTNTALTDLDCYNNQLTILDLSNNPNLTWLNCFGNQLTELGLSNNTALTNLNCYNNQLMALDLSNNTALASLDCSNNQLTALDLSNKTKLATADCSRNQIKGAAMDVLVTSLDQYGGYLNVYNNRNLDEGNVCTKSQVAVAKAKGWVIQWLNNVWEEYEGIDDDDPTAITRPITKNMEANTPVYTLSGQKVTGSLKGKKGVYIVGGKKVVVK